MLGIHHDLFSSEAGVHEKGRPTRRSDPAGTRPVYQEKLEAAEGLDRDEWGQSSSLFRAAVRRRPGSAGHEVGRLDLFRRRHGLSFQKAQQADQLIDIWGADHAGTVKRIKAAVEALTEGRMPFDVKLVQMVRLLRAGEPVKMSKRSGNFVTLADVVGEVGKDVVRFTMLNRKADAQMDFDFAKVVEASKDNPVFYVQYAHARISSLGRKAPETVANLPAEADLSLLDEDELGLVKLAAQFPRVVEAAAAAHEPHRIAFYLGDLAAAFHAQWNMGNDDPEKRFLLAHNPELTRARLELANGIGQIVRNGLALMGVKAAEEML